MQCLTLRLALRLQFFRRLVVLCIAHPGSFTCLFVFLSSFWLGGRGGRTRPSGLSLSPRLVLHPLLWRGERLWPLGRRGDCIRGLGAGGLEDGGEREGRVGAGGGAGRGAHVRDEEVERVGTLGRERFLRNVSGLYAEAGGHTPFSPTCRSTCSQRTAFHSLRTSSPRCMRPAAAPNAGALWAGRAGLAGAG